MEKEEEETGNFPSFKKRREEEKENLKREKNALTIDLEKIIREEEDLRNERIKLTPQLNSVLLKQYTQLYKVKKGPVVVPMKEEVCEGCNVKVSPSLISKIKRREEVVYCENCNRILYMVENTSEK